MEIFHAYGAEGAPGLPKATPEERNGVVNKALLAVIQKNAVPLAKADTPSESDPLDPADVDHQATE